MTTQNILQYGLIGKSISYSFSPVYFTEKFKKENIRAQYQVYELDAIENFPSLIDKINFKGLNVTIPYKESIIPYLDKISPIAEEIGAVNTIVFHNKKMKGYNTDWIGAKDTITYLIQDSNVKNALILGTGGASKAIQYALKKMGLDYLTVSRSKGDLTYKDLTEEVLQKHLLLINTTPLGTFPHIDESPNIPYYLLTPNHRLFDLVYNPRNTLFLKQGVRQGAKVANGHDMLIRQAEASWELYRNL